MADGTALLVAVHFVHLPHRHSRRALAGLSQFSRVGRRRRQFLAKHGLENPFPAHDRASPRGQRGCRQDRPHAEYAAPASVLKLDQTLFAADHSLQSVVLGEILVEIAVGGIQDLQQTAILAHDPAEKARSFLHHGFAQRRRELGKSDVVGLERAAEIGEAQPLSEKGRDEGLGLGIGDHARDLLC